MWQALHRLCGTGACQRRSQSVAREAFARGKGFSRYALISGGHDVIEQARGDLQLVVSLPADHDLARLNAPHDLFNDALQLVDGMWSALIVDQRRIGQ
jgi:hypothetical protein